MKPGKTGAVITGIGYEPTPEGAIVEEAILDPAAIGAAVRRLFAKSGITVKNVVSSVSGQSSVVVRIIEVPRMTTQELAETMKWEVERHIPFPSSEVVMDFKPLERPSAVPGAQNMEVLLAVCQEDVVKKHIDMLSEAKLNPKAIEVEAVALPRSLVHAHLEAEAVATVAVADIGYESTKVCIYEKKLLVFPRTVPIAAVNLIRAISQAMGLEEHEAETLLREQGLVDIELLNRLSGAPPPEPAETQYDMGPTYSTPFSDPDVQDGPDIPSAVPPTAGFDLGDEFIVAPAGGDVSHSPDAGLMPDNPFAPEAPKPPSSGGVFDLGDDQPFGAPAEQATPSDTLSSGSVFDLGDMDADYRTVAPGPVFDLADSGQDTASSAYDSAQNANMTDTSDAFEPDLAQTPAIHPVQAAAAGDQTQVAEAIAPVIVELAAELSRSLDYYNARNTLPVEMVIICGGVAKIPGLAGYLEQSLGGMRVMVGDPVGLHPVDSKHYAPEYLAEIGPVFSTCVGLALRDFVGEA